VSPVVLLIDALAVAAVVAGNGFLTLALALSWAHAGRPADRVIGHPGMGPRGPGVGAAPPAIAVIRPVHGPDASAGRANEALLAQLYAGAIEFVFVASRADDPGLAASRAAHRSDPRVRWILSATRDDTTDKASGMIAGWHATSAPLVAFCDADVLLDAETLAQCVALFDADDVGGVFSPALHAPATGLQRLASMVTSGDKLVTVRALDRLGLLTFMEGGLMVVRRAAVGPIDVLRETVADDLRLASVLRAAGYRLRAGPANWHAQPPGDAASFARQYHRWMACQRVESPGLLVIQLLFHALLLPLLAWAVEPASAFGPALLGASVAWRIGVTLAIEHHVLRAGGLRLGWWVLARPAADLVHVAACVSAFAVSSVRWGGRTYRFSRRPLQHPAEAAVARGSS
jgi:ceramide glucosyltransferase